MFVSVATSAVAESCGVMVWLLRFDSLLSRLRNSSETQGAKITQQGLREYAPSHVSCECFSPQSHTDSNQVRVSMESRSPVSKPCTTKLLM